MRPQTCSYFKDKCRDPKWGEDNCMIDHTVFGEFLWNQDRYPEKYQQIHRWMDQGAISAIPVFTVKRG